MYCCDKTISKINFRFGYVVFTEEEVAQRLIKHGYITVKAWTSGHGEVVKVHVKAFPE